VNFIVSSNIIFHPGAVMRHHRELVLGQRGCVVWLTGLSGAGKSTIAHALEAALLGEGRVSYVLDGDNVRHGLNADLGFAEEDRKENVRRVGEVAALLADVGLIAIASLISPYRADREQVRGRVPEGRFLEVFVDVPADVCEIRDPKGLYRRARKGEIAHFTGVSAPYEPPTSPELHIPAAEWSIGESVQSIRDLLAKRELLRVSAEAPVP
jgi:adenylylsulfate kinase